MQQLSLPIMLARRRAAAAAGSIAAPQEELAQASQLQAPPVQAQPVSEAQPQRQEALAHGQMATVSVRQAQALGHSQITSPFPAHLAVAAVNPRSLAATAQLQPPAVSQAQHVSQAQPQHEDAQQRQPVPTPQQQPQQQGQAQTFMQTNQQEVGEQPEHGIISLLDGESEGPEGQQGQLPDQIAQAEGLAPFDDTAVEQANAAIHPAEDTQQLLCRVCGKKPPTTSEGDANPDDCQCARCFCFLLIADEPSEALQCAHVASLEKS